jgi:3-oxoacyl-[acyl-carrier-protein] synthase I
MTKGRGVCLAGFAGCSSLGYSMEPVLAAMAAGLSNFTDTGVPNLVGTPVSAAALLDPEMPRRDRLAALAELGLADLQLLLHGMGVESAPLMLGLPADLTDVEAASVRAAVQRSAVARSHAVWLPYGRASTFTALASAMDLVERGAHPLIVVGGIDSLCAPDDVARLVRAGRVLGPHTEGTIPGEAAAFMVVTAVDSAIADPATLVRLEATASYRAALPFTKMDRVSGDGLAAVFRSFRERGAHRVHLVVAAHSGEGYFGRSFAHAYLREIEVMPEPLQVELIADRVGDAGAAAGPLGLAFARLRMVTDPRGEQTRVMVYSESDTGELGAVIVEGAPVSWERRRAA